MKKAAFDLIRIAIVLGIVFACCVCMTGCDSWYSTTSYNGQKLTADQVASQARIDAEKEKAKAKTDADRLASALRTEADEQATKQARRKAEFDTAIATLDSETRIRLASLQAEYEIQSGESARAIARMQANTESAIQHVADRTNAALADIDSRSRAANADIESKIAFAGFLKDAIGQNAGLLGPVGTLVGGLVTTGLGISLGRASRQKAVDAAWDDGHKTATETAKKADDAWDAAHVATIANLGIQKALGLPGPVAPT